MEAVEARRAHVGAEGWKIGPRLTTPVKEAAVLDTCDDTSAATTGSASERRPTASGAAGTSGAEESEDAAGATGVFDVA